MKQCGCGNVVPEERFSLGFKNCVNCAQAAYKGRPKGVMVHTHKTGSEIQILQPDVWKSQKKYFVPNGPRSTIKNFSRSICA